MIFGYIGGYGKGIYALEQGADGMFSCSLCPQTSDLVAPSYLLLSSRGDLLYALSETAVYQQAPGGSVAVFSVDKDGTLRKLCQTATLGADPCFGWLEEANGRPHRLFTANYTGGTVSVFSVDTDGAVTAKPRLLQTGQAIFPGVDRSQRPAAHPHCTLPIPDGKHLAVADLGLDAVIFYDLETLKKQQEILLPAGQGPRHLTFSRDGNRMYLVTELGNRLFCYAKKGDVFERLADCSLLPDSCLSPSAASGVHLTADDRYLLAANRWTDTLVCMELDGQGMPHAPHWFDCQGQTPRDFALTPDNWFVLVANQQSDTVVVFSFDPKSGEIGNNGMSNQTLPVPMPACFAYRPGISII